MFYMKFRSFGNPTIHECVTISDAAVQQSNYPQKRDEMAENSRASSYKFISDAHYLLFNIFNLRTIYGSDHVLLQIMYRVRH